MRWQQGASGKQIHAGADPPTPPTASTGTPSGTTLAGLRYDPLGRLYELYGSSSGANTGYTRLLYDGDALVAEYTTAGTLLRRYVHGPDAGADDPLIWFEGTSTSFASARHLYVDPRG